MTLDEAIEHANQVADSYKDTAPACKCAREHKQLANWLTELKMARECMFAQIPSMARTISDNHDLSRENKLLRKRLNELDRLCNDMWTYHNEDCHSCPYHEECKERDDWQCIAPLRINERARSLGVGR